MDPFGVLFDDFEPSQSSQQMKEGGGGGGYAEQYSIAGRFPKETVLLGSTSLEIAPWESSPMIPRLGGTKLGLLHSSAN